MTYEEFQLRLFKKVFDDIKNKNFIASMAVLTGTGNTKVIPLPSSLYDDKEQLEDTLKSVAKLAQAKMCCFVSMCNISKIDKDTNPEAYEALKNIDTENLTPQNIEDIAKYSVSFQGLIFNFEAVAGPSKAFAFVLNEETSIFELQDKFSSDDENSNNSGRFMNILEKE
jgi:hypothetical protein